MVAACDTPFLTDYANSQRSCCSPLLRADVRLVRGGPVFESGVDYPSLLKVGQEIKELGELESEVVKLPVHYIQKVFPHNSRKREQQVLMSGFRVMSIASTYHFLYVSLPGADDVKHAPLYWRVREGHTKGHNLDQTAVNRDLSRSLKAIKSQTNRTMLMPSDHA